MSDEFQRFDRARQNLSTTARSSMRSGPTRAALLETAEAALGFLLSECEPVDVASKIPKEHIAYRRKGTPQLSRPANKALFRPDPKWMRESWELERFASLPSDEITRLSYTMVNAVAITANVRNQRNQWGGARYFECFVGHLFARELGVDPMNPGAVASIDEQPESRAPVAAEGVRKSRAEGAARAITFEFDGLTARMTMDLLFDPGEGSPKIHLPCKMSSRERVVQIWAHQRMLDAAFPADVYRGVLVINAEIELNEQTYVSEVWPREQWIAYQKFIARMDHIYFLDVPHGYSTLTDQQRAALGAVKPLGEFFRERAEVVRPVVRSLGSAGLSTQTAL